MVSYGAITTDQDNKDASESSEDKKYKDGFSSSIGSYFFDPSKSRIDCCSLAFFGIFQHHRNLFLLKKKRSQQQQQQQQQQQRQQQNETFSSEEEQEEENHNNHYDLETMIVLYIIIPMCLYYFSMWVIQNYVPISPEEYVYYVISMFVTILYFILLWCCYRVSRTITRNRIIIHLKQQEEEQQKQKEGLHYYYYYYDNNNNEAISCNTICVHEIVGCSMVDDYDNDTTNNNNNNNNNNNKSTNTSCACCHRRSVPAAVDICGYFMKCLFNSCCGFACGCWLQFCGICALAQEGRELERDISPQERMDYITLEPFVNYYIAIQNLRQTRNNSSLPKLSKLSKLLLRNLIFTLSILCSLSLFGYNYFHFKNFLVLLFALAQSFLFLFFIHLINSTCNWFNISLDAVIKCFASGFFISSTLAIFFERIEFFLSHMVNKYGTGRVYTNVFLSPREIMGIESMLFPMNDEEETRNNNTDETMMASLSFLMTRTWDLHYTTRGAFFLLFFLFLKAFVVAALVEEVCKYYGFRMIEHADFDSEDMVELVVNNANPEKDEEEAAAEGEGGEEDKEGVVQQVMEHRHDEEQQSPLFQSHDESETNIALSPLLQQEPKKNRRSYVSRAAAITVAMVAVAVGFECCENLLYVFFYSRARHVNGSIVYHEVAVLIMRSLIPLHPIAAAIQSIDVCRQEIEQKRIGIGQILLPALFFHGSYDFFIFASPYLEKLLELFLGHTYYPPPETSDEIQKRKDTLRTFKWIVTFGIIFLGLFYYMIRSFFQQRRLREMDQKSFLNCWAATAVITTNNKRQEQEIKIWGKIF